MFLTIVKLLAKLFCYVSTTSLPAVYLLRCQPYMPLSHTSGCIYNPNDIG